MFWLRILVPRARHDDRRLEAGQRLALVLVVVDGDDLAGRARVELLDLALEPERARRGVVELVRQGDLDQRRLDPEDLGGHAEQLAAGLLVGRGDVELEVVHQGDEEAAGVGAELGRLLRADDPQRLHPLVVGLAGGLDGLQVVGEADVLA